MFRNFYTTQMSGNAKALFHRFETINTKPVKTAKIIASMCMILVLSVFIFGTLVIAGLGADGDYVLDITNNGKSVELENKPFIEDGVVYLPLREFFTNVGLMDGDNAEMKWNDGVIMVRLGHEGIYENDEVSYIGFSYKLEIGNDSFVINPEEYIWNKGISAVEKMESAPILKDDITYVPFSFVKRLTERANSSPLSKEKYDIKLVYSGKVFTIGHPLEGFHNVTAAFGKRLHPISGEEIFHDGTDFEAIEGSSVKSGIDGVVFDSGFDSERGNYIVIRNEIGIEVMYCHLSIVEKEKLEKVEIGEIVGKVGRTGMAAGAHLHMSLKIGGKYVNPESYLTDTQEDIVAQAVNMTMPRYLERIKLDGYEFQIEKIVLNELKDEAVVTVKLTWSSETKEMEAIYKKDDLQKWQIYTSEIKNAYGNWSLFFSSGESDDIPLQRGYVMKAEDLQIFNY